MRPSNSLIMSAANNATHTSTIIWANDIVRISVQAVVTGTPTGSLQMWVSNDLSHGNATTQQDPLNWTVLGTAVTISAAGTFLISEIETSYEFIKLVYTDGSSGAATGTITVRAKAMGL